MEGSGLDLDVNTSNPKSIDAVWNYETKCYHQGRENREKSPWRKSWSASGGRTQEAEEEPAKAAEKQQPMRKTRGYIRGLDFL